MTEEDIKAKVEMFSQRGPGYEDVRAILELVRTALGGLASIDPVTGVASPADPRKVADLLANSKEFKIAAERMVCNHEGQWLEYKKNLAIKAINEDFNRKLLEITGEAPVSYVNIDHMMRDLGPHDARFRHLSLGL